MTAYNPGASHFALFGLPAQYALDLAELNARYRDLQQKLHPDRYAGASERERRLATQSSSQINEAFETLRSPTRRAAYLLRLAGVDSDSSSASFDDGEFLMQQMQLREELAEIADAEDFEAALAQFYRDLDTAQTRWQQQFAGDYDGEDYASALQSCLKLQFLEKLRLDAERKEEELLGH